MRRTFSHSMFQASEAAKKEPTRDVDRLHELLPPKEHSGLQYTPMDGDLLVRSGRFSGLKASDIVHTVDGRDYLGRVWKTANTEIKDILRPLFSD